MWKIWSILQNSISNYAHFWRVAERSTHVIYWTLEGQWPSLVLKWSILYKSFGSSSHILATSHLLFILILFPSHPCGAKQAHGPLPGLFALSGRGLRVSRELASATYTCDRDYELCLTDLVIVFRVIQFVMTNRGHWTKKRLWSIETVPTRNVGRGAALDLTWTEIIPKSVV